VYLNPIGSTCNRCCDCKQMVRSKNNTLKGKREIPYRKQGKNKKKYEPVSQLFFEGHYNTKWVLYCSFIL